MNVSIIIPCFNEEKTISEIIHSVKKNINDNDEIIVIDDYSTDKTRDILEGDLKNKINNLILNEKNFGKGYSIRKGIEKSKGDIILIQDADLEYFPKDINKLIKKIRSGNDIVFGNRFHKLSHYHYKTFAIANFFISKFVSILYLFKISDVAVCYKMFKRNVIDHITINSKDFMFDFEFVSKVLKKNIWKISEVNISYKGRTFKEGKKISWLDGFRALFLILKVKIFY